MAVTHSVVWSERAKADLRQNIQYIRLRESVTRAAHVRNGIIEATNKAAIYPTKHRIEPIYNRHNIRFVVKWRYKIIFQIEGTTIRILAIFHTAQSPNKVNLQEP